MPKLPSNLSIRKFKSPWHGQTRYVVELEEKVGDDWEQAAHLWASAEKSEPWVSVSNARIATEYRGKGLYPVMLKELRDLVQADGYKGIVSFREGRQGGMSDRSWEKFADREPRVKEMKGDYYLSALPKTGRIPIAVAKKALKLLPPGRRACKITAANLRDGLEVEREHRDVTRLGLKKTALIAASHLCESPRYYTELKKLERRLKRSKK